MKFTVYNHLTEDAKFIRDTVFVKEQGFQNEYDEADEFAKSLVVYDNEKPVGTCRFYFDSKFGCYHIGRIAILKEYRKQGLGAFIVTEAEKNIADEGGNEIVISGQVRVAKFYEKLGYTPYGEPYDDEGVPHIELRKTL